MEYMTQEQYKAYRQSLRDQGYRAAETGKVLPKAQDPRDVFGSTVLAELFDPEAINFLKGFRGQ